MTIEFPRSQGELIKLVRGPRSQKEFAAALQIHPSLLSRYESEALGAPTAVINHCLAALAGGSKPSTAQVHVGRALEHARLAVGELERVQPTLGR